MSTDIKSEDVEYSASFDPDGAVDGDSSPTGIDSVSRTPEELLEVIRESLAQTRGRKPAKGTMVREAWQSDQEMHVAAGVLACDELLERDDATPNQYREAWKSKAVLLYRAAEFGWSGFDERLSQTVIQLKQTTFNEEAEYADGLLLVHRCFERKMPVYEVVENLTRHAREFPGGDTCAKLFLAYANKLEERGLKNSAKQCCQAALWVLHDHPELAAIRHQRSVLDAKEEIARHWAIASGSIQLQPHDAIQAELEQQVSAVRDLLPIRVDSATTLTKVSAGVRSINYQYTVTISAAQMDRQRDSIQEKVTRVARSVDATRVILAKGVALNYAYHDPTGNQLLYFSVTK
ncbi:MAG: hypothetical protein O3B13_10420 [Planctomycetota bacterium]|nr:hypothetical protein [Planctomycetota bacterium]